MEISNIELSEQLDADDEIEVVVKQFDVMLLDIDDDEVVEVDILLIVVIDELDTNE